MYCADCESVDDYFFHGTTHFWIFVPTVETFVKFAGFFGSGNIPARQENSHCIVASVASELVKSTLTSINGLLEGAELAGTKVTTMPDTSFPSLDAMARMTTFDILIHRYEAKWLIESIENERYETWFQPIVDARQSLHSPTVFAHEGLFRVRDANNIIVPPHLAFLLAEKADLLFSLDLVARRSAVQHAAAARLNGKLFINFNPSSIYDPSYCLRSTAFRGLMSKK